MNILFATIAWPEPGERNIYSDLMDEFVAGEHKVYILCARERRSGKPTECIQQNGLQILRVRCGNLQKTSIVEKGLSLFCLNRQMLKALEEYYGSVLFDLIICSTPPITLAPLIAKIKSRHNAKVYLLLKDMWPQGPVDMGALRKGGMLWRYFRRQEQRMYRHADFIGCMSPAGVHYVLEHNPKLRASQVEVCPNSIRPGELQPDGRDRIRAKYHIPMEAVVFLFGGNLGKPQGLPFFIEAIKALGKDRELYFLIIGSGTHFAMVRDALEGIAVENAAVYQRLPKQDYDRLANACDVGLILLDGKYTIPHFPSRLLSYLDAGMPVLLAVNRATDIGNIIEQAGCGNAVVHGDLDGFVKAARDFAQSPENRIQMGTAARRLLEEQYTANHSYRIIMKHFPSPESNA